MARRKRQSKRRWTIQRRGVRTVVQRLIKFNFSDHEDWRIAACEGDMKQAVWEMATKAIHGYDSSRGRQLEIFFSQRVTFAIIDELQRQRMYGPKALRHYVGEWTEHNEAVDDRTVHSPT